MTERFSELIVPDLDLGDAPIVVTLWHVRQGARVMAGDRLVELHAAEVVVDVVAPRSGRLVERSVAEEERVRPGQTLGHIAED